MPSTPGAADEPMRRLDSSWYNSLAAGLQLDPGVFQSRRPAVLPQSDAALWACEDVVPPGSAVFNTGKGVLRFSDAYQALVSGLTPREDRFRRDVGEDVYQRWSAHVGQLAPPSRSQLPALFRRWAILNAPGALQVGVSRLAQAAHAISPADRLAPYCVAHGFDFAGTVGDLVELGRNAAGGEFTFDSMTADGGVSRGLGGGEGLGSEGLWMGSSPDDPMQSRFALARVRVLVRFRSCVIWAVTPGTWYNSSFLNLAFSQPGTPPWPAGGVLVWEQVFGPGGYLRNLVASLVVLDGLEVTVRSEADFADDARGRILEGAAFGFWPLYIPSFGDVAINRVGFGAGMTIEIRTHPANPVVVGAHVLDVARYLGREGRPAAARASDAP